MQSIDDTSYQKYFSMRTKNSKWSEKNKALVNTLEEKGIMSDFGRKKIEEAKSNGQWSKEKSLDVSEEHMNILSDALKEFDLAYANFQKMSFSVRKTYTRAYFDAKTEKGRESRMKWIVERLNQNLKPM